MAENTIERVIKIDTAGSEKTVRELVAEAENARKALAELQGGADGYAEAAKRAATAEKQLAEAMAIAEDSNAGRMATAREMAEAQAREAEEVNKLVGALTAYRDAGYDVSESLVGVTTSTEQAARTTHDLDESVNKLRDSGSELIETLIRDREELNQITAQRKALNKEIKQGLITEEQAREVKGELLAQETVYKSRISESRKELSSLNKTVQAADGSYQEMSQTLGRLRAEYRQLSEAQRNSIVGEDLLKQIQSLDSELKNLDASMGQYQRNVGNYAGGVQKAFAKIGAAWMAIKGIYSFFSSAIDTIKDFEQANANLATILGASAAEMDTLRESALELGRTTEYTASQVTLLQTELAKLGFGPQSIQAMEEPILHFATAVGAKLPEAANLAGATLRIFGLEATQTEDTLDVLATSTNKSALSFDYLNNAMSTVGPVANTFGLSVRDTTALLAALANSGFEASTAATATRNILLNLADANGKLAQALGGPVKTIPELVDGLKKLNAQGIDLAGTLALTDKRSVAAFNTFLNGADSVKELRDAFEDVGGTAKKIAEERLNTVEGSIKLMQSAWEGLVLSFYESKGVIKTVIDGITSLITGVTELINPSQNMREELDKQADYVVRLVDDIQPLADEYDTLKSKVTLTADEQERLKIITSQLGDAYPPAIAAIDEYGNAVEINTQKIRDYIETEKLRLQVVNADSIKKWEKEAEKQRKIIERNQEIIKRGTETRHIATPGGPAYTYEYALSEKRIKEIQEETQKAQQIYQGALAELERQNGTTLERMMEESRQRSEERDKQSIEAAERLASERAKAAARALTKEEQRELKRQQQATEKAMRDTLKMEQQAREKTLDNELKTAKENYDQDLADFNKTVKEKNISEEVASAYRKALAEKQEADIAAIREKYRKKAEDEQKKQAKEESKQAKAELKNKTADLELGAARETAEAKRSITDPEELEQKLQDIQQKLYEARIGLIDEMINSGQLGEDTIAELSNMRANLEIKNIERVQKAEEKASKQKQKEADLDKKRKQQTLAATASFLDSMSQLVGEDTKAGKALAVSSALISTYVSAQQAYQAAFMPAPTPASPVLGAINMAAAIASGLMNVKSILSVNENGTTSVPAAASTPAVVTPPAVIEQVPLTRTLTSASEEERLNQMASPQKVYVVYDDIAEAGRTVEVQQRESTF